MMRSGQGSLVVSLSPANSKTESEWYESLVNISTTSTEWHPVHSVACQPVSKRPMAHYSRRCAASAPPNATELKCEANKNAGTILTSGTIASNRITDQSRKSCSMTWLIGGNPRCLSSPIPALFFKIGTGEAIHDSLILILDFVFEVCLFILQLQRQMLHVAQISLKVNHLPQNLWHQCPAQSSRVSSTRTILGDKSIKIWRQTKLNDYKWVTWVTSNKFFRSKNVSIFFQSVLSILSTTGCG